MSAEMSWRLGSRPALDGLRGIAVILVLLEHGQCPFAADAGIVGVNLFFVMSGFLITSLLLEEFSLTATVDIRSFYARRIRRLAPAFLFSTLVACLIAAVVPGLLTPRDVVVSVAYVGNWVMARGPVMPSPLGLLSGTWSLAIEEQFYLVWPLILVAAMRLGRRAMWLVTAGLIAASVAIRVDLVHHGASLFRIQYATDVNAVALLAGVVVALLLHGSTTRRCSVVGVVLGAVGMAGAAHGNVTTAWLTPLTALFSALIVWSIARGAPSDGWLTFGWLRWVGRRSYGIYLWNCIVALVMFDVAIPWEVRLSVLVALSLVLAEASWRWVESPFVRHHRFESEATAIPALRGRGRDLRGVARDVRPAVVLSRATERENLSQRDTSA